jgi:DNA-binding NarL/FixJ family response regulator
MRRHHGRCTKGIKAGMRTLFALLGAERSEIRGTRSSRGIPLKPEVHDADKDRFGSRGGTRVPSPSIQLLLVEDNPRDAHRLRRALAEAGPQFQVSHVARLSEALARLCEGGIDLILLDLSLPDGQGAELVTLVVAVVPQVPIVVLVNVADTAPSVEALRKGAQDYLIKEYVDAHLLAARVRLVLAGTERGGSPASQPARAGVGAPAVSGLTPTHHPRPRPAAPDAPRLCPGDVVHGYAIERMLGDGGMGSVYLACQLSLGRKVAVKFLADRFSRDRDFVRRFDRESAVLANLSHPNIVTIFDKGVLDGRYYFVMEYVDGVCLREILTRAKFSAEQVLRTAMVLCEALEYAHSQGVIHRDIKPENLLFTRAGQLKVTDFGLARLIHGKSPDGSSITPTGTLMGTQDYMAPEARHSGKHVDHRCDIYSLGVILYEMLAGELPVGRFEAPSGRMAGDARVDAIVLKALEAAPDKRYQRASEVGRDLAQLIRHHGPWSEGYVPLRLEPQGSRRGTQAPIRFPSREAFGQESIRIAP